MPLFDFFLTSSSRLVLLSITKNSPLQHQTPYFSPSSPLIIQTKRLTAGLLPLLLQIILEADLSLTMIGSL